jgi:hypothetical protein
MIIQFFGFVNNFFFLPGDWKRGKMGERGKLGSWEDGEKREEKREDGKLRRWEVGKLNMITRERGGLPFVFTDGNKTVKKVT